MDMYDIHDNNSTRHCNNLAQSIPDQIHNNICCITTPVRDKTTLCVRQWLREQSTQEHNSGGKLKQGSITEQINRQGTLHVHVGSIANVQALQYFTFVCALGITIYVLRMLSQELVGYRYCLHK